MITADIHAQRGRGDPRTTPDLGGPACVHLKKGQEAEAAATLRTIADDRLQPNAAAAACARSIFGEPEMVRSSTA